MAHGKLSRARNKEKRRQQKAARKAANRAKYDSQIAAGTNLKDKSKGKKSKKRLVSTVSHPNGACGNIGCKKCNYVFHFHLN